MVEAAKRLVQTSVQYDIIALVTYRYGTCVKVLVRRAIILVGVDVDVCSLITLPLIIMEPFTNNEKFAFAENAFRRRTGNDIGIPPKDIPDLVRVKCRLLRNNTLQHPPQLGLITRCVPHRERKTHALLLAIPWGG
jgi:hypothetical protein